MDTRENRHVNFVREFANVVSVFQDKVDALIGYYDDINKSIEEMKGCPYQVERFEDALGRIQKLVCIIFDSLCTWLFYTDNVSKDW